MAIDTWNATFPRRFDRESRASKRPSHRLVMIRRTARNHLFHLLMNSDDTVALIDVFIDACHRIGPAMTRRGVFFAVMLDSRCGYEGQFVHLSDDLEVTLSTDVQDEESFKRALISGWDVIEGRWL